MIWADPLHVLYLGAARDFVLSGVKLLMNQGVLEGATWAATNEAALASLRGFCVVNNHACPAVDKFDFDGGADWPTVAGLKAMDVKLMIMWLASLVLDYHGPHAGMMQTTSYCIAK